MYLFFFTNLLFALFIYMVLYSRLPNNEGRTSAVTFGTLGSLWKKIWIPKQQNIMPFALLLNCKLLSLEESKLTWWTLMKLLQENWLCISIIANYNPFIFPPYFSLSLCTLSQYLSSFASSSISLVSSLQRNFSPYPHSYF